MSAQGLIKTGHWVWILSIYNIGVGLVIPEFNWVAKSISHVALEAPVFRYSHRLADILIGLAMCGFAIGCQRLKSNGFNLSVVSMLLLGISMISAGIWTLESRLHLLYGLSIFMIVVPLAFIYDFNDRITSEGFKQASLYVTVLHITMFWLIYAGFIPGELNGLIQRVWAVPTMGWFGWAVVSITGQVTTPKPAPGMAEHQTKMA